MLDPDPHWIWIRIRIGIQPKMLDPDAMNADPQPCLALPAQENRLLQKVWMRRSRLQRNIFLHRSSLFDSLSFWCLTDPH
jgi:hypothetical protein